MTLTKITLTVLIALLCSSSAQVPPVSLERIIPKPGDPLCPGDEVKYNCVVKATQLIWTYTSDSGGTISYDYFYADPVEGNPAILGPFELVLKSVDTSDSQFIINSTATTANGLAATENGKVIACLGTVSQPVTISFTVPTITNASVCMDTIYWSPPLCDANCTVSVGGQDIGTVSCSVGSLRADSDLSNKTVVITTTDQLGNNLTENAEEVCEEMSTTQVSATNDRTIVESPDASSNIATTEFPAASSNIAGVVGAVVPVIVAVAVMVVVIILISSLRYGHLKRRSKRKHQINDDSSATTDNSNKEPLHPPKHFNVISLKAYEDHKHSITHCAISPDAEYIVSGDANMVVRKWNTGSHGSEIVDVTNWAKENGAHRLVSLNWVNRRQLMLTCNNLVMIHDISKSTSRILYKITAHGTPRIFCGACSPSNLLFAFSFTKSLEGEALHVRGNVMLGSTDYSKKKDHLQLAEKQVPVISMSFSHTGRQLVTGNIIGEIKIYDCNNPKQRPRVWKVHDFMVYDVQFGATDETKIYTIGEDCKFYFLDSSMDSAPIKSAELEYLFCHEPSFSTNIEHKSTKTTTTFRYLCRNKLFAVGFANNYVLIGSDKGGIVYKIDSDFKFTKVEELYSGDPVTCVDWVTHNDDLSTCVMGFASNSVKVEQLNKNFGLESPQVFVEDHQSMTTEIASNQQSEEREKAQQCTGAAKASLATSEEQQNTYVKETNKQTKEVGKSFLPSGKGQEGPECGTAPSSTSEDQQSDEARSAKPQDPHQTTGDGQAQSKIKNKPNSKKEIDIPPNRKEQENMEGGSDVLQITEQGKVSPTTKGKKQKMEKHTPLSSETIDQQNMEVKKGPLPKEGGQSLQLQQNDRKDKQNLKAGNKSPPTGEGQHGTKVKCELRQETKL